MKKFIFTLLLFSWGNFTLYSQTIDEVNTQIDTLNQKLENIEQKEQELQEQLDKLRLKRIHQKIVNYCLPAHPDTAQIIHHKGYSLSYNKQHRQANWVAHIVTDAVQEYESSRTDDYRIDTAVQEAGAEKGDYWYSGYDRGHLAPSADFRWDSTALSNTYLYSNMAPMHPFLNRKSWAKLENYTREWALQFGEVWVVSGGVLNDDLQSTGQHSRQLSVPKRFYKVIVDYSSPDKKGVAFILPNDSSHLQIYDYAVTIDSVEQLTGIDFFHQLPDNEEETIERNLDLEQWKIQHTIPTSKPLSVSNGRLNTKEAKEYIGEKATVCGTVVATKYSSDAKGKPTFLNFDKPFPNSPFSVTIWGHSRKNFPYAPEKRLIGKEVCVTSKIKKYQGTPQMVITHQEQVEILDANSSNE